MDGVTQLVGSAAAVCTVASNFSGLPVSLEMSRKKSTLGKSCLPFLSAFINGALWLQYGVLVGDRLQQAVNSIAVTLQLFYLWCFYSATPDKAQVSRWLSVSSLLLLSLHGYYFHVAAKATAVGTLGLLSSGGSILMFASPLSTIREVLQKRSTESLSFLIIFGNFVVSTLWCIYGHLVADSYIQFPNFMGALLCSYQLSLFIVYGRGPRAERDFKNE